jgi:hypothetical protein
VADDTFPAGQQFHAGETMNAKIMNMSIAEEVTVDSNVN